MILNENKPVYKHENLNLEIKLQYHNIILSE